MATDEIRVKEYDKTMSLPNLPVVAPGRDLVPLTPTDSRSQGIDIALGLVALVVDALRAGVGSRVVEPSKMVDASLGATRKGWTWGSAIASRVTEVGAPVVALLANPPLVPRSIRPVTLVNGSADVWRNSRPESVAAAQEFRDGVIRSTVESILERLDLTELVVEHVDLTKVVTTALDSMDLTALARERIDLLELADYIVEGIDLPEIIRQSTGSVASESVRALRLQSVDADEAVQRIVDRVLLWRRRHSGRNVNAPTGPENHS